MGKKTRNHQMRKLVVIAPTYNEQENVASFIDAVLAEQKKLANFAIYVLVSDSHSSDSTARIVKDLAKKNERVVYLDVKERGLGLGLFKGLNYAVEKMNADLLITMEADLSNDPKQIPDFVEKATEADLVIGSRYIVGGAITNWSWWRKALSKGANLILMALAFTKNVHEFTNLYRLFRPAVWSTLRAKLEKYPGWLFVPAFVFEALDAKVKFVEQPIVYFDRFGGRSKMRTLSYTKNLLLYALKYRIEKSASVFRFAVVGGIGFLVNTVVLVIGVKLGMLPSVAGPLGAELAIIVGFTLNNRWTFAQSEITSWRQIPFKFIQYNVIALGSVVIQFAFLRVGEILFGVKQFVGPMIDLPVIRFYSWYMFFYMWGVGVGMVWNYIMYSKVVWKNKNRVSGSTTT